MFKIKEKALHTNIFVILCLTKSTVRSLSEELTENKSPILWRQNIHYCVHKNLALNPILKDLNPVYPRPILIYPTICF